MPTFPITATRPAYYSELHALDRYGNVFYTGDTVQFTIVDPTIPFTYHDTFGASTSIPGQTPRAFTGNYYVRNYYGTQVASGTLTAATTLALGSSLPYGWYKIFLTQTTNDATYGFAAGGTTFLVWPTDARFPTLVGWPLAPARRGQQQAIHPMRGAMMHAPNRYVINNCEAYNTGTPGDLDNIISCITNELDWYHNPAYQDSVRPHRSIVEFVSNATTTLGQTGVTMVVSTLCNMFGVGKFVFEGPANEPGGSGAAIATNMATVYNAIKAGNASAFVIGPDPVSINNASRVNNKNFMTAAAGMTPVPIQGISFHAYNCLNGDLAASRTIMDQWVADLVSTGLDALPRFQTEQGFKTTCGGTYMVRFGARWDMQMLLLFDQYGIPKEQCHVWYDSSHGFWATPHFWQLADQTPLPPTAMFRTHSAELYGKTYASKLDFGTPGNDMMLGNRYHDSATGNDVIALQAAGGTDHQLRFTVEGASSITQVDCFGNTSTLTATAGQITVNTKLEPLYLRVPSGVTVTLVPKWTTGTLVRNLETVAAASSTGGATNRHTNIARVNNGVQENAYIYNVASTRNNVHSPYFDDTGSFPAWLSLTTGAPQRMDRVIIFASPPWQAQGTLLDFDVQTWNGTSWDTQTTITEPVTETTVDDPTSVVFPFVDYQDQGGCQHCSFFSDRWIFDVPFASMVSTTAIRIFIRNATYGMPPTLNCWTDQAGDKGTFGNNFVIREVQTYCSDLATKRVVKK